MKNKSIRMNLIRLKKVIAAVLVISIFFVCTGCGKSSDSAVTENKKQKAASTADVSSSDELNKKRDNLYQQENQFFADHKDVWDKAFSFMSKNTAGDAQSENYADFLASTVEANKDSFSEEEYKTLSKDIEKIRGIEEEIAKVEKKIAAAKSSNSASSESGESTGVFHDFKGKDLDGNDVDNSFFSKNKVTVVNFWFSGCKPCVGELSKLNELNETLKKMGGEVVGINTDTLDNNEHLKNTTVSGVNKHANRTSTYEYHLSGSGWAQVNYPHIATSDTYGHWVCVVGISPTADPDNLKESDFYALDPARVSANGTLALTRLLDGTIWTANSPLKIAG